MIDSYQDRKLAKIRNRQIGFIFQTFHLVADLSVLDNVEIPLLYRRTPGGRAAHARDGRPRARRPRLARPSLSRRSSRGGQQQRVAIARAIVGQPRILLADEPTGNLDSQMGDEIMAILQDLNRSEKTTIVMVTHDQRLACETARIIRLFDGRMVN